MIKTSLTPNDHASNDLKAIVQCHVIHEDGVTSSFKLPGLIDTGSHKTLIPISEAVNHRLGPGEGGEIQGITGAPEPAPGFFARVALGMHGQMNFAPNNVLGWKKDYVLIGRDILNQCALFLDGQCNWKGENDLAGQSQNGLLIIANNPKTLYRAILPEIEHAEPE